MPVSRTSAPKTYTALRRGVENVVLKGRLQIERAWVQTYHECGRMIHEHLLLKKDRADYGAAVYSRLAEDCGISSRTLHDCVNFYRAFPILRARAKLTFGHYRLIAQVGSPEVRSKLVAETEKYSWSYRDLESRVRAFNATLAAGDGATASLAAPRSLQLLTPERGMPGIFRLVARGEALAVDLGFKLYLGLSEEQAEEFSAGDFVTCDARGRAAKAGGASKADLFTYAATVRRVIDGDTLAISLRLPGRYQIEQKLRLRGLDCPEMDTDAGKAAKRFTESLVAAATAVTIYTSKPDKYDRYLADVFLAQADGEDVFLNNALLQAGHAVRKDEWSVTDWEG